MFCEGLRSESFYNGGCKLYKFGELAILTAHGTIDVLLCDSNGEH